MLYTSLCDDGGDLRKPGYLSGIRLYLRSVTISRVFRRSFLDSKAVILRIAYVKAIDRTNLAET
jgi:hypothetical protein